MACCLFRVKPELADPELVTEICQLDPQNQTSEIWIKNSNIFLVKNVFENVIQKFVIHFVLELIS